MEIHIVKPGETIYSIARQYNVSPARIIEDNLLPSPGSLATGQALVILIPAVTYTVQNQDTLQSIANKYGVTIDTLFRNNPILAGNQTLYPGQTLVISYEGDENKRREIAVNGYAYPFIEDNTLRRTLPYLTYITPFTYGFNEDGSLVPLNDEKILRNAADYAAEPIMLISTLNDEGRFDNKLSNVILNDQTAQNKLIQNILTTLKNKNYKGLDVDFEYIYPEDKDAYIAFIQKLIDTLNPEGYLVWVALAPKTRADQPGLLYEAHDYNALGNTANGVLLMTYEWGYTFGPPMAVAPIDKVREVVEYAVTEIPPEKMLLGIPNYGYDWTLPYVKNQSMAESLSIQEAVDLAVRTNSTIEYDETSQAPYFYYSDQNGRDHVVWMEDARSIQAKLDLAEEFGLRGVSVWNIMDYFPQLWLVINSLYNILISPT